MINEWPYRPCHVERSRDPSEITVLEIPRFARNDKSPSPWERGWGEVNLTLSNYAVRLVQNQTYLFPGKL